MTTTTFEGIPTTELIQRRFSCRKYARTPITGEKQDKLTNFLAALPRPPFGSRPRFGLVAAQENDSQTLHGLGTYGFIRNAAGFVVGAITPAKYDLEDYGYLLEMILLYATALDLGTCWLGGTFNKSRFAEIVQPVANETMPAIAAIGEFSEKNQKRMDWTSRLAGSHKRLDWDVLFSNTRFAEPLYQNKAGAYAQVLEMVRIAPSASNKQPWRIVKHGDFWRLYLQRTPGYRHDPIKRFLDIADMQRLDMGIATCHFELTAQELGLPGQWVVEDSLNPFPKPNIEYIVSWQELA